MNSVILHLSATRGKKMEQIEKAIHDLVSKLSLDLLELSSYYESEGGAFGGATKRLNRACKVQTILTPKELLAGIQSIERRVNVSAEYNWEESQLSILIITYNSEIICDTDVTIPHPKSHQDPNILIPTEEIAASYIHPVIDEKLSEICAYQMSY